MPGEASGLRTLTIDLQGHSRPEGRPSPPRQQNAERGTIGTYDLLSQTDSGPPLSRISQSMEVREHLFKVLMERGQRVLDEDFNIVREACAGGNLGVLPIGLDHTTCPRSAPGPSNPPGEPGRRRARPAGSQPEV